MTSSLIKDYDSICYFKKENQQCNYLNDLLSSTVYTRSDF